VLRGNMLRKESLRPADVLRNSFVWFVRRWDL
jgi:hypothetical protein